MHQGKYLYRSPTRLWQFEPRYRNRASSVYSLGKWRYTNDDNAWVDWDANSKTTTATSCLLQDEEIPPEQYQTMEELQRYIRRRRTAIEEELVRRCRQARVDLEQEALEESERAEEAAKKKDQPQNHVTEVVGPLTKTDQNLQTTTTTKPTTTKGINKLMCSGWSSTKRVWSCLEKYMFPEPAVPTEDWPLEFGVAPEDEPLEMRSEQFRKRLSLLELEIEDDCEHKMLQLEYILNISVPAEMIHGAPDI